MRCSLSKKRCLEAAVVAVGKAGVQIRTPVRLGTVIGENAMVERVGRVGKGFGKSERKGANFFLSSPIPTDPRFKTRLAWMRGVAGVQ